MFNLFLKIPAINEDPTVKHFTSDFVFTWIISDIAAWLA